MRLDKFLKVARIIKRRTLAKEICVKGQITLNGRVAKAGAEIKQGDKITINFGYRELKIEVCELHENVPSKMATTLYNILEDKKIVKEN